MGSLNGDMSYIDFISILSLVVGLQNLRENEQQSSHSEQLIKQIDMDTANDKQARYLIDELDRKFEEQTTMLREILEVLKGEKPN